MNANNSDRHPDLQRALNRCVARTLVDLRRSVRRNRTIPLPTLLRLFKRRWAGVNEAWGVRWAQEDLRALERAGVDTVRTYYCSHQPLKY